MNEEHKKAKEEFMKTVPKMNSPEFDNLMSQAYSACFDSGWIAATRVAMNSLMFEA